MSHGKGTKLSPTSSVALKRLMNARYGAIDRRFNAADLTAHDADLGLVSADFNVLGDFLLVAFDPDIGSLLP